MTLTAPHQPHQPHEVEAPTRWQRIRPPVVLAGIVVALSLALHVRDPHESGSWGFCPWLFLTGTYCPGCGGLRAVNDLTRGEVGAAASSNVLFLSAIPLVGWFWVRSLAQRWRGVRVPLARPVVTVLATAGVVLAAVFWVARNIPAGAWLAP